MLSYEAKDIPLIHSYARLRQCRYLDVILCLGLTLYIFNIACFLPVLSLWRYGYTFIFSFLLQAALPFLSLLEKSFIDYQNCHFFTFQLAIMTVWFLYNFDTLQYFLALCYYHRHCLSCMKKFLHFRGK